MPKISTNTNLLMKYILMGCAVGIFVTIMAYYNLLADLERRSYDFFLSLERGEPDADILIVGITDKCLEELGSFPWKRKVHAHLLEIFHEGEAGVVGMDIIFSEYSAEPEMDRALVDSTAGRVPVVYPEVAELRHSEIPGFFTSTAMSHSFAELKEVSHSGFINLIADPDGILRRVPLWMEYKNAPVAPFSLKTYFLGQGGTPEELSSHLGRQFQPRSSVLPVADYEFPLDPRGQTLINYCGGPHTFPVLPYHSVLQGDFPPATFQGRTVLVGYYALGLGDYFFTPFQKDTPMFGIEVHANVINTLHKAGPINPLPLWQNLLVVFILSIGSILIFQLLRPLKGFFLMLLVVIIYYLAASLLFNQYSLYVETVYPVMAVGLSYLTSLFYTFIVEQRERQRVTRIFGRYVASQVVEEILQMGEENLKLGGTRRDISVLFVDIRGFTPLAEKLPPEEVVNILNEYFAIVTDCIFRNKGMVDKFMGDAVMAVFNAPIYLEEHPLWALKAARDIIAMGGKLREKVMEIAGVDLYFGIGINTGEAVVGNIGAENRVEYTVIGDVVNLASRLEANAGPGQVLVSRDVYEAAKEEFPLKYAGEISVKGKTAPVEAYQLLNTDNESSEEIPP